jgi:hypothetical protein
LAGSDYADSGSGRITPTVTAKDAAARAGDILLGIALFAGFELGLARGRGSNVEAVCGLLRCASACAYG